MSPSSFPYQPHTAPASRQSFPGFGRPPTSHSHHNPSTTQVRRRSALGQSMLFGHSDSASEPDSDSDCGPSDLDKESSKNSETEEEDEHECNTPPDEHGPVQPLLMYDVVAVGAGEGVGRPREALVAGAAGKKKNMMIEGNMGRRPTAEELRTRLSRHATPSVGIGAGAGVGVGKGQGEMGPQKQQEQQRTASRSKVEPRKQLGLKAAIGSYQEKRRVGHRRSQSSTSVEIPKLADDLRQVINAAAAASPAPSIFTTATTSTVASTEAHSSTPISPSIQVTPASPEKPRWVPLPSTTPTLAAPPVSSPALRVRRVASDNRHNRTPSDELPARAGANKAPPSLEQIRKWAIRREKTNETPKKALSEERTKARSALDVLTSAQGTRVPQVTVKTVIQVPSITIVPAPAPAPAPSANLATPIPTVTISRPPSSHTTRTAPNSASASTRSFSLPSRSVRSAPSSPPPTYQGYGVQNARARAAQAQSMMARLSLRAASIAATRPTSPVLHLVSAV